MAGKFKVGEHITHDSCGDSDCSYIGLHGRIDEVSGDAYYVLFDNLEGRLFMEEPWIVSREKGVMPNIVLNNSQNVGRKDDQEKRRWNLLLGKALLPAVRAVVDVLMFGAKKYGDDNFLLVENADERYYNAALRHLTDWREGKKTDEDTKLSSLAHCACCILFLLASDLKDKK